MALLSAKKLAEIPVPSSAMQLPRCSSHIDQPHCLEGRQIDDFAKHIISRTDQY